MKKLTFIFGIIGVSIFSLNFIWNLYGFVTNFIYSATSIVETSDGFATRFTLSARYFLNLIILLVFHLIVLAAIIIFIRMLVRTKVNKPINTGMIIALIVVFALSVYSQISAIPSYLILSRLNLLNTLLLPLALYIVNTLGILLTIASLVLLLVNNIKSKKMPLDSKE